jgi:hypothetical protein
VGRGPLVGGLCAADLLVCPYRATDEDDSVADFGLVHGGPCAGDGQQDLRMSVRVAMLSGKGPLARREKSVARNRTSRNAPCPCGSGKKYKHCCYGKGIEDDLGLGSRRQPPQYPIGTVAMYGPDDKTTTKIAAGVTSMTGPRRSCSGGWRRT